MCGNDLIQFIDNLVILVYIETYFADHPFISVDVISRLAQTDI